MNDQQEHARELATLLRAHKVAHHVNLIPFNPIADSDYRRPSKAYVSGKPEILYESKAYVSQKFM